MADSDLRALLHEALVTTCRDYMTRFRAYKVMQINAELTVMLDQQTYFKVYVDESVRNTHADFGVNEGAGVFQPTNQCDLKDKSVRKRRKQHKKSLEWAKRIKRSKGFSTAIKRIKKGYNRVHAGRQRAGKSDIKRHTDEPKIKTEDASSAFIAGSNSSSADHDGRFKNPCQVSDQSNDRIEKNYDHHIANDNKLKQTILTTKSGPKPLQQKRGLVCHVCKKGFTLRTNLTRHIRRLHVQQSFRPEIENHCSADNESVSGTDALSNPNIVDASSNAQGKHHNEIKNLISEFDEEKDSIYSTQTNSRKKTDDNAKSSHRKRSETLETKNKKPVQRRLLPAPKESQKNSQLQHRMASPSFHGNFIYFLPNTMPHSSGQRVGTPAHLLAPYKQAISGISPVFPVFHGDHVVRNPPTSSVAIPACYDTIPLESKIKVPAIKTGDGPLINQNKHMINFEPSLHTQLKHTAFDTSIVHNPKKATGQTESVCSLQEAAFSSQLIETNPSLHVRSKSADGLNLVPLRHNSLGSLNSSANTSIDVVNISHENSSNLDRSSSMKRHSPKPSNFLQVMPLGNRFSSEQNLAQSRSEHNTSRENYKSHSLNQLHHLQVDSHKPKTDYHMLGVPLTSHARSAETIHLAPGWNVDPAFARKTLSAEALNLRCEPPPLSEHPKVLSTPGKLHATSREGDARYESENEHGEPLSPLIPNELNDNSFHNENIIDSSCKNLSNTSGSHIKEALEKVSKKLQSVPTLIHRGSQLAGTLNSDECDLKDPLSPIVSPPPGHSDLESDIECDGEDNSQSKATFVPSSEIKEALKKVSEELHVQHQIKAIKNDILATAPQPEVSHGASSDFNSNMESITKPRFRTESGGRDTCQSSRVTPLTCISPVRHDHSPRMASSISGNDSKHLHADSQPVLSNHLRTHPLYYPTAHDGFPGLGFYDFMSPHKLSRAADTPVSMAAFHGAMAASTPQSPFNASKTARTTDKQDNIESGSKDIAPNMIKTSTNPAMPMPPPMSSYNAMLLSDTLAQVNRLNDMALSPFKHLSTISPFKSQHDFAAKFHEIPFMSPPKGNVPSSPHMFMNSPRFYGNNIFSLLASSPQPSLDPIPPPLNGHLSPQQQITGEKSSVDAKRSPPCVASPSKQPDHVPPVPSVACDQAEKKNGKKEAVKRRRYSSRAHRFDCTLCDAKFTFRTNLTRHMKKVHDTIPVQT